jgi:hypothetical protein
MVALTFRKSYLQDKDMALSLGASHFCAGARKNVSLGQGEVFDKAA